MPNTIQVTAWVALLTILTACGSVSGEDNIAALATENSSFITEAAAMRGTLSVQEAEVMSTSIAAETVVARENIVNAGILATVRAADPPTVAVVARIDRSARAAEGATPDPNLYGDGPAGTVIETYVTTEVQDSDGCGVDRMTRFPTGTLRLFGVQRVQNVPANTLIGVEWFYGGSTALSDTLVVTTNEADICLWFFLEPYSQGEWSMQFYSNGTPVGERVNFTVGG
jgi:hypothetical protein